MIKIANKEPANIKVKCDQDILKSIVLPPNKQDYKKRYCKYWVSAHTHTDTINPEFIIRKKLTVKYIFK